MILLVSFSISGPRPSRSDLSVELSVWRVYSTAVYLLYRSCRRRSGQRLPMYPLHYKKVTREPQVPRRSTDGSRSHPIRTTTIHQRRSVSPLHPKSDTFCLRGWEWACGIRSSPRGGFGSEETGFLGRWKSRIIIHHFILTAQVSFWDGFEQQQGPAVEHEFDHFDLCCEAARIAFEGSYRSGHPQSRVFVVRGGSIKLTHLSPTV